MKFIFLLLSILSFTAYSNNFFSDTCELKGPVKSITYYDKQFYSQNEFDWNEKKYTYNKNRYLIRYNLSSSFSGKNINTFYRVYDGNNILCLKEYYIQEGDTLSWEIFTYNSLGQLIKSSYYNYNKIWNNCIYLYNSQGNLTSKECTTVNGDFFPEYYEYDEKGRIIYFADLSTTWKKYTYWVYDEYGRIIEEKYLDSNWAKSTTHYMGNDNIVDSIKTEDFKNKPNTENSYVIKFNFNELNQISSEQKYDISGNLIYSDSLEYNEMGDVVNCKSFISADDKTYIITYSYKYDKYGNWIEKTSKYDNELYRIETQKIKYY